jgi:aspartate/methionine/tyrosine aminotransferase
MKINDFKLEVFFGKYEFTAPYLLAQSDCESMTIGELLAMEPGSEERFFEERLGYTEVPGNPELRQEIAKLYKTISSEQILVHSGAQEPIYNFMQVLLEEKDHIISQFPVYQSLYEVANAIGCDVGFWKIKEVNNEWVMDFDELESMIQSNTKAIVVNNPNNPTGFIFNEEEMIKLCKIAKKHDVYLFADEVYHGLEHDGTSRPWFADLYDKAVSLGVLSKAHGLPGLRLGWIATQDVAILDAMTKMKHYTTICTSGPSEFLGTVAVKNEPLLLERSMTLVKENLEYAKSFFEKYKETFTLMKPLAGPIALVKVKTDLSIDEYCHELIEKSGILLLPGSVYDLEEKVVRMGFGRKDFKTNLDRLDEYMSS